MKVLSLKTGLTANTARMQATHTTGIHTRMNMGIHMTKLTRMTTDIHMTSRTCTVPVVITTIDVRVLIPPCCHL